MGVWFPYTKIFEGILLKLEFGKMVPLGIYSENLFMRSSSDTQVTQTDALSLRWS